MPGTCCTGCSMQTIRLNCDDEYVWVAHDVHNRLRLRHGNVELHGRIVARNPEDTVS